MNLCRIVPPVTLGDPALVTRLDDASSVEAAIVDGNPLAAGADPAADVAAASAPRVILWSGTLGDGPFDAHPATWLAPGRAKLDEVCGRLLPVARAAEKTVCFRPHARHVLSDAPSCLQFRRDHEGEPLEIALSPATMIEPSMFDVVEDHLVRFFEILGASVAVCFLDDVTSDGTDGACRPAPLGQGVLPRVVVRELLERCLPPTTPVVLRPEAIDAQREWLGA